MQFRDQTRYSRHGSSAACAGIQIQSAAEIGKSDRSFSPFPRFSLSLSLSFSCRVLSVASPCPFSRPSPTSVASYSPRLLPSGSPRSGINTFLSYPDTQVNITRQSGAVPPPRSFIHFDASSLVQRESAAVFHCATVTKREGRERIIVTQENRFILGFDTMFRSSSSFSFSFFFFHFPFYKKPPSLKID